MSETLESPRSSLPAGFPFADPPQLNQGPVTVINPEKRARPAGSSSPAPTTIGAAPASAVDAELGSRLFPAEYSDSGQSPNLTGVRLEHFELQERIGVGGMGAVFRATDLRLQRIVALKVLSPSQSRDPSSVQRFLNEAQAGARFDHENIARVFHVGQDRGIHFIAFEYVAGVNLRDLIRANGRLDPGEAVSYTLQIASALRHTNAAGVVHRDIKPSNILITPNGRAKLVDLGLARSAAAQGEADLTVAGTTLGTFDYISPEQARDPRSVDVRSDIYSLGCTLYHMLTGEAPYPEGTVLQKLLDHQGGDTPDPAAKNRHVTPELSAVVRRMMASDPKRRYSTPDDVIQQLLVLAGQLGLRAVSGDGLIWAGSRSRLGRFWEKNLPWMLTASVLILVVVILDRYPALGQRGGQSPSSTTAGTQHPVDNRQRGGSGSVSVRGADDRSRGGASATEDPRSIAGSGGDRIAATDSPLPRDGSQKPLAAKPGFDEVPAGGIAPVTPRTNRAGEDASVAGEVLPPRLDDPSLDRVIPALTKDDFRTASRAASSPGPDTVGGPLPVPPAPVSHGNTRNEGSPPREKKPTEAKGSPGATVVAATAGALTENPMPREGSAARSPTDDGRKPAADRPATEVASTDRSQNERSPKSTDPRPPEAKNLPAIVVLPVNGGEPKSFPTLEAACAQADDGQVIELRYNGSREPEKPFRIANRKITIRGAKGFRPVVEFAVKDATAPGQSTRMISLAGGALEFNHIDFRLTVADQFAVKEGEWAALVSLSGTEQVRFQSVAVTVINPSSRPAAVIEVAPAAGQSMPKMMTGAMPTDRPRYDVKFVESFLRGNAEVAVVRHTNSGQIDLEQSVVSVEGAVLALLGRAEPSTPESQLRLSLDHVTAVVGNGLLRVDSGDGPRELLIVSVHARNNAIGSRTPVAMVSMTGATNPDDFRRLLRWHGEMNFYDRFDSYRSISTPQETSDFDRLDFDAWKKVWSAVSDTSEVGATRGGLPWKERWWERSARESTLSDFELTRSDAPAIGGATDGSDAGADMLRLSTALRPTMP
ncbi:MAG: protein kinase [Planctomycetaceae bacterium]|nr:protein kinase [Planctomycetaceae bacterium]